MLCSELPYLHCCLGTASRHKAWHRAHFDSFPSLRDHIPLLTIVQNHLFYDGQKKKFDFLNILICEALMVLLQPLHKFCVCGSICLILTLVTSYLFDFSVKSEARKITSLKYCCMLASGLYALGRSKLFLILKDPA